MARTSYAVLTVVAVVVLAAAWALRPARSADPVPPPTTNPARFSVTAQVLPGHVSMTLFYVTDSQTNNLYIYRAMGKLDASFNDDPELYRTYDLSSAGQKKLLQAK